MNYIAIDFETANYYQNSACQIGLVRFENGIEVESFSSFIKPGKLYFVPEFTNDIHGISYEDVLNKPQFPEIWDKYVMPFMNKKKVPLVAHNASFDMNVIKECCKYYGMDIPDIRYFDSLALSKKVWPNLESHKLTSLGEYFEITYLAHDALEDSRTCGIVVKKAAEKLGAKNVDELIQLAEVEMCHLCED